MPEEGQEGTDSAAEDQRDVPKEEPVALRIKVHGISGCPEEAEALTVSYSLDINKWEEGGTWEGEAKPSEEGGVEQTLTHESQHEPPTGAGEFAAFLHTLVKVPVDFKVAGLAAGPGKFSVSLVDLIWQPPRDPDDDDDGPRLPRVSAWFPVLSDSEEAEEFPEGVQVHVTVELSQAVVPEDELKDVNLVEVTDESPEDHQYKYTLRYSLPGVDEATTVTVEPGVVVPAEVPTEETASGEEGAEAEAPEQTDGEGGVGGGREEGEGGETKPAAEPEPAPVEVWHKLQHTDREVSSFASAKEQRIEFEHTRSEFLLPIACKKLMQSFQDKSLFPIEISRTLSSGADYRYEKKYHGLAQCDISSIRDQDVTMITIRCPVGPHDDFEAPTEEEMENIPEGEREEEERLHDGTAANPYLLAETYLVMEIRTHFPLNPKPPPPPAPLATVREVMPQRAPVPVHGEQHAGVDRFREDVRAVMAELQELFGDRSAPFDGAATADALEARRTQLVCHLSETGRMHDFKAKLKQSVAQIIRERFKQQSVAQSAEESNIIAELNAALKEEINKLLFTEFQAKWTPKEDPKTPSTDDKAGSEAKQQAIIDKEKRLAEEAEVNLDYGKAIRHLNRRVVTNPKNPQLWYELGAVVLRSGDIAKAQECFRMAVAEDKTHLLSLLAFGILLTIRDKYAEADKYFKEAVSAAPQDVLGWSCAALFYDLESRDAERRTAMKQMQTAEKKAKAAKRSPYLRAAQLCLDLGSTQMVERAMTQELHLNYDSVDLQVMLGRAYLANGQWDKCRQHLSAALTQDKKSSVAMTLMGHSHYMEFGWPAHRADMHVPPHKEVTQWYDKALNTKPPWIETLQYVRLAKMQIAVKKYSEAQETLRKAANLQPSATAWLGRAIALYHMGEVDRAEEALQEAAILDDHNPEVWAASAIVALIQATSVEGEQLYTPKAEEAKRCFARAHQGGLSTTETFPANEFLLTQAGSMFLKIGQYESAAAAFRRALLDAQGQEALFGIYKSLAECLESMKVDASAVAAIEALKKCAELASTRQEYDAALHRLIKKTHHNPREAAKYDALLKKDTWVMGQAL